MRVDSTKLRCKLVEYGPRLALAKKITEGSLSTAAARATRFDFLEQQLPRTLLVVAEQLLERDRLREALRGQGCHRRPRVA